jgi:hypothetical protein
MLHETYAWAGERERERARENVLTRVNNFVRKRRKPNKEGRKG